MTIAAMTASVPPEQGAAPRYPLKDDPYSSHSVVADAVRRLIGDGAGGNGHPGGRRGGDPLVVVDAGCGSGPVGTLLAGAPVTLVGIDTDPAALDHARAAGYTTLLRGDLDLGLEADASALPALPEELGPADVLICADMLEHCRWPETVLRCLLDRYLRPGGTAIISLPNVAHWYVRAQLLAGRWNYAERGILDSTHLRFFTAATAAALLEDAGIRITRRWTTPLPLPVLYAICKPGRPLYGLHVVSAHLTRRWPGLLAYQLVFAGTYHGR
jgi:2-polyprenyl-3-methyl-5-hydroxy-6-metoxy-1,4-benzoquinol methylase